MVLLGWMKRLFCSRPPEPPKTLIWGVVEGPFLRDDFPEEELWEAGVPPDVDAMLVCKIEEDGEVFTANYWYGSMDEAYEVKKYFDVNMEPLEVRHER